MRVVEPGRVACRHEHIPRRDVVAAGAAQAAHGPGVDDLAVPGGQHREPGFGCPGRRQARLAAFMDDAEQHHPGAELASADQRPPTAHAKAARDSLGHSGSARAVGGDDIGLAMDGSRRSGRQLGDDPVRVAVPDAPGDGRVEARQLLEHLQALRRREIQPAIGLGKEDAEKALAGQFPRQLLGQAASRLDTIALCQDTRPKRASSHQKRCATALHLSHQSCDARNVSQLFTSPFCRPRSNQRTRCALVPWVKLSGTTRP